jgi:NADPH:quinone reductase-like Zn-dependent oxidoreductase
VRAETYTEASSLEVSMRALVYDRYGSADVVSVGTVDDPVPGPRDVVLQQRATAVNSGDARLRKADFPDGFGLLGRLAVGWSRPRRRVLGVDVAGVVTEVGSKVTEFAPGDRVVGQTGTRMGAHAERVCVSVDHCLVRLPDAVPFEEAAALPFGGCTALTFLDARLKVQRGERVLVVGASGSVGVASVQVARQLGAHVTGVCSGANEPLVRSLGAEHVIDYTRDDLSTITERWDVVVDTVGHHPVASVRRLATPRGRVGLVAGGIPQMLAGVWANLTSRQHVAFGPADENPAYVERLVGWVAAGEYVPVIHSRHPWEHGAEAHALVDSHHKRGSVVLTFP